MYRIYCHFASVDSVCRSCLFVRVAGAKAGQNPSTIIVKLLLLLLWIDPESVFAKQVRNVSNRFEESLCSEGYGVVTGCWEPGGETQELF